MSLGGTVAMRRLHGTTRNNVSKNRHFENDVRHGNRHYCACQTKENRTFTQKRTPQRTHTVRYSAKTTCACNPTSTEKNTHMCLVTVAVSIAENILL